MGLDYELRHAELVCDEIAALDELPRGAFVECDDSRWLKISMSKQEIRRKQEALNLTDQQAREFGDGKGIFVNEIGDFETSQQVVADWDACAFIIGTHTPEPLIRYEDYLTISMSAYNRSRENYGLAPIEVKN